MNVELIALIASMILSLGGVIYKFGRMTQVVDTLSKKIELLCAMQQEIEENRQRIVVIETKLENRRTRHAEA